MAEKYVIDDAHLYQKLHELFGTTSPEQEIVFYSPGDPDNHITVREFVNFVMGIKEVRK